MKGHDQWATSTPPERDDPRDMPGACEYCGAMDNYREREALRAEVARLMGAGYAAMNTVAEIIAELERVKAERDLLEHQRGRADRRLVCVGKDQP